MQKINFKNWNSLFTMIGLLSMIVLFSQCKKDDDDGGGTTTLAPTAVFSVGTIDGLTVPFVNASVGGGTYVWDFGDGNTSTDKDPTHTYSADGTYTVTLTATNEGGTDDTSEDVTVMLPVYKNFIVGKTWIPAREDAVAYHLGPADDTWTYDASVIAPWFSVGDLWDGTGMFVCGATLEQRIGSSNDEYTFNEDGTYNINWNGDFWGEFGIWAGTAFNEVNIDIVGGSLPARADGVDVSAFVKETQNYIIDENAATLKVTGDGAHIGNPRYKDGDSSYDTDNGTGITYTIHRISEGPNGDTLVLFHTVNDLDFGTPNNHYFTFVAYDGTPPDIRPNAVQWTPTDYAPEVSSCDVTHDLVTDAGFGSAIDQVTTSSEVVYGDMIGGETCTKFTRTDADGGFTDFKMWSTDSDIRLDVNGTYDCSMAQLDVYIPSSNDFSGALANQVEIILGDESGLGSGQPGSPGFWTDWVLESQENIALDQWVTLTFDFTGDLDDMNAASGVRDNMDLVVIRLGGSNHPESGVFYMKDFKFVQ